jgi:hypothetical protein
MREGAVAAKRAAPPRSQHRAITAHMEITCDFAPRDRQSPHESRWGSIAMELNESRRQHI